MRFKGPILAISVSLATGCSWALVDRRSDSWTLEHAPSCATGLGPQYADLAIAGAALATIIGMNLRVPRRDSDSGVNIRSSEVEAGLTTLVGLPIMLVYTTSALTGMSWRSTCKKANASHAEWREGQRKKVENEKKRIHKRCRSLGLAMGWCSCVATAATEGMQTQEEAESLCEELGRRVDSSRSH